VWWRDLAQRDQKQRAGTGTHLGGFHSGKSRQQRARVPIQLADSCVQPAGEYGQRNDGGHAVCHAESPAERAIGR
jgi:hypothetical protein